MAKSSRRAPCGVVNRYRKGCRCDACRVKNAAASRAYRARKRAEGVDVTARYRRLVPKVCAACGESFEGRPEQRFCSQACKGGVAGECVVCGAHFRGPESRIYCSERCSGRWGRALRRRRERAAFVAPVDRQAVFERDGWRCQICGERVDRRCKVPHPRSAVLDHIIPLAQGGTHEPKNVQCAHFLCNSAKADGAANDQLRLIG